MSAVPEAVAAAGYDPRYTLAFMHVPKTSGTALQRGLAQAIGAQPACDGLDRSCFGSYDGFDSMSPALSARVYANAGELPHEPQFAAGHFAYSTLRQAYPRAQLITFMREPLSRLLSHWLYWRSFGRRQLRGWGDWAERVRLSHGTLARFLEAPQCACVTDNLVLRMLLWRNPLVCADGFIDPAHDPLLLRLAGERLLDMTYADVIENPRLTADLAAWLGRPLCYAQADCTRCLPLRRAVSMPEQLDAHTLGLLEARTRLDLQLWKLIAGRRVPLASLEALRVAAVARSMARHALLGGASGPAAWGWVRRSWAR